MKTLTHYTQLLNNKFTKKNVIAPVESSSTASQAYTEGKKFFYNNILYEATDDIAKDGLIVPDTNCTPADNIIDQIENKTVVTDPVPTQGSTNPIQSGGVYNSLDPVYNVLGAKNIVPNIAETKTVSGVTRTVNTDGSITLNGTATAWGQSDVLKGLLPKGTYKISIGTPLPSKVWATLRNDDTSTTILNLGNGSPNIEYSFTLSSDANVRLFCGVEDNTTVSNLTFYPMIRPASITDDTYVPYSMTNREMTPYVQAISNPNLLDNPWFTINQRGQSSYSGGGYTVDRWKSFINDATISISSNGITITRGSGSTRFGLLQYFENLDYLRNKVVTASIMLRNGTIKEATFTIPDAADATDVTIDFIELDGFGTLGANFRASNPYIGIMSNVANASITIRAVKLELGSVSTLAMDTAPNYATELLKCQRYFIRLKNLTPTFGVLAIGIIHDPTFAWLVTPLPVTMRATPTITLTKATESAIVIQAKGDIAAQAKAINSVSSVFLSNNMLKFNAYFDSQTAYEVGTAAFLWINDNTDSSSIDLSADL